MMRMPAETLAQSTEGAGAGAGGIGAAVVVVAFVRDGIFTPPPFFSRAGSSLVSCFASSSVLLDTSGGALCPGTDELARKRKKEASALIFFVLQKGKNETEDTSLLSLARPSSFVIFLSSFSLRPRRRLAARIVVLLFTA